MSVKTINLSTDGIYLYESKHPRGNHISGHCHDHFQILYALDGEGEVTLEGKRYEFIKDHVILIAPNSVHSIKSYSKLTTLVLAFYKSALVPHIGNKLLENLEDKSHFYNLDMVRASDIRQILRKLLFEKSAYDSLSEFASPVYLLELLIILIRLKDEKAFDNANDMRSMQLREYIDKHFYEYITAESLSSKFGISPRYINDIFKAKFHETPLKYLQKVRINHAEKLLIESDKDIVSICFEVGFETLSTFYRTFRNLVGMSPHKYRTSNASSNISENE